MSVSAALAEASRALLWQYVQSAERLNRGLDHPHDTLLVRNVYLGCDSGGKVAGDALCRGDVDIGNDDAGSLARHQPCGGLADSTPGACHDRDFAFEALHWLPLRRVRRPTSGCPRSHRREALQGASSIARVPPYAAKPSSS
jgi:hypothetical protein